MENIATASASDAVAAATATAMAGEEKQKAGVVAIHSQVMKIKQEIEKIKHPSLDQQPEIRIRHVFLRDFSRQRSRSPLGLAHRPISVGNA